MGSDQAQRFGGAGLAEQALAGSEHDREDGGEDKSPCEDASVSEQALARARERIFVMTWFADSSVFPLFGLPRVLR